MKLVVIGGSGLIGSKLVPRLREHGHEAVAASPDTGVNTLTVAKAIARIAVGVPLNGTVEVAGPQQFRFDELIRQGLGARHDPREVVVDPHARYFGAELGERSLIPAGDARLGEIRFQEWLNQPVLQR